MISRSIHFANSTRLAIQATMAVTIAIVVGHFLPLDRSYWAVLTAMFVSSQTWGESVKKSFERILMTIIGGVLGTLLYFSIADHSTLMILTILISVFFIVYFMGYSYLWATFFITVFVVFLFATLKQWNVQILEERIIETIIGAVIAVATAAVVFPMRGSQTIMGEIEQFVGQMKEAVQQSFLVVFAKQEAPCLADTRHALLKSHTEMRQQVQVISYELLFTLLPRRKLKLLMMQLSNMLHYTTSLMEVAPNLNDQYTLPLIRTELQQAQQLVTQNFNVLVALLARQDVQHDFQDLKDIRIQIRQIVSDSLQQDHVAHSCWFDDYSFFYFLMKLNEEIGLAINLLLR